MTRPDSVEERMRAMVEAAVAQRVKLWRRADEGEQVVVVGRHIREVAADVLEAAGVPVLLAENEQLRAELERLRGALDFYADPTNYLPVMMKGSGRDRHGVIGGGLDGGKRAREALAPNQTDAPEGGTDGE